MDQRLSSEEPLAPFVRLAPSVYLANPTRSNDGAPGPLIVLSFWMNAPIRPLVKYVTEYARLAPEASIIFIRNSTMDLTVRGLSWFQEARVAAAVRAIIDKTSDDEEGKKASVHLHVFSNGGATAATHLLSAYRRATGNPLPISSMIVDSAPGTLDVKAAMSAFSYALPKMWILRFRARAFLYVIVTGALVRRAVLRQPDVISWLRTTMNDTRLVCTSESSGKLKRCYIYSDTDDLIDWRDVEEHAAHAEASGWTVYREKFLGTAHVGHMRADPDRYWSIVKSFLEIQSS